jgi:phosphate uptake regulator
MGEAKRKKSLASFFREAAEAVDDPDVQEALRLMERADPEAAKHLAVIRSVEPLIRYAAERREKGETP